MNILVITPDYPDKYKVHYPFVKQLVDEFARQGHHCYVIAPYSITKNKRRYQEEENVSDNITIYRPNHLSFSNYRIGKFCPSLLFRQKAINRAFRRLPIKPDVVYCHFWESALEGYQYAKKNSLPLFVASGESSISTLLQNKYVPTDLKEYVSGVVCVSTKNKEESISLGLTTEEKCFVKPNAVNSELFRKLNKEACRKKLGLPLDVFIISFVGSFIERKGANRVGSAIKSLSGAPVYSIFAGRGNVEPDCENILFKGSLRHEIIPEYLNASDVFVLPTLAEGCCNAIVEAMACGLPIISSNRPFNWDVLNDSNSIMIDPESIQEIANAIKVLRDNPEKRNALSVGALETAKNLTIEQRVESIVEFMESKITELQK
jgi:glycosyltransferase involved in cell wall biosynthesis